MIRIRIVIALTALILVQSNTFGQHVNSWRKGKLTYETREKVKKNSSRDSNSYDANNDFVEIKLEVVNYSEESFDFLNDLKKGCREICMDRNWQVKSEGEKFLPDDKSYYVICMGKEPIITAVILREDSKRAYEISIHCYKIEIQEGIEILKSIKFD